MKRFAWIPALSMLSACALGQGPADVPSQHWAADAVANLYRLGVLNGYPDGQFRGGRPVSRYEMATAIYGLHSYFLVTSDRLQAAIDDLKEGGDEGGIDGLADIRRRLDVVQVDVNQLQALRPEIDDLESRFKSMGDEIARLRESIRKARESARG